MVRASVARRLMWALVSLLTVVGAAPKAHAFEYFDGRIQVHGYFEETVRVIATDFNQGADMTQWYNILKLEMDLDIAKDGWGPFDSISGYIGAEVRYDCIWTRACGISPGVNVYGNRSESLPSRLSNGKNQYISGNAIYHDPEYMQPGRKIETFKYYPTNTNTLGAPPITAALTPLVPAGGRLPARIDTYRGVDEVSPFSTLTDTRVAFPLTPTGPFVDYIPGRYTFQNFLNYGYALRNVRSGNNGFAAQSMPWDPKDNVDPQATLRDRANPFNPGDINPIIGTSGAPPAPLPALNSTLPMRPFPRFLANQGPSDQAAGLFLPSQAYARYVRDGGSDEFDQNFNQNSLAWNRGGSQRQTKELKEAYLDMELLEGKLFMRLGRQTIVWGKTELFATTDLFNAQDLALGSLTSLEESRIPQWALRSIYSFYEVGPFEDVRLEAAMSLDTFYPVDLGRCGEPYTPNPVCDKTNGLIVHGVTGIAVAGEDRPDYWWNDAKGVEFGARLEFRWDRFSFAIVDFWNYTKFPYADRLSTYSRNVDVGSGRPRVVGANGPCTTGNEPACLQGGNTGPNNALDNSSLNQQLYGVICSASVGFSGLDRTVCAQSVFTSQGSPIPGSTVTMLVSQLVAGSPNAIAIGANTAFLGATAGSSRIPLVALSIDAGDGIPTGFFSAQLTPNFANAGANPAVLNHNNGQTLAQVLTVQQQALLGCGPFYGTSCDGGVNTFPNPAFLTPGPGGVDLLNAEASALMQSWTGFEGTPQGGILTTDNTRPQPGTVGFQGGPICTRYSDGKVVMLPGCRGPGDPGYNPAADGPDPSVTNIGFPAGMGGVPALGNATLGPIAFTSGQPFTGQTFRSEMAALSWNFQATLVAFSTQISAGSLPGFEVGSDSTLRFDPANAYRTTGCSYVVPWMCSSVRAFWGITGVTRQSLNAGGNGRFGRRDMVWAQGGEVVLKYQKRNVLGFSTDFAEDVTKTNWSTEFTWVQNNPFTDNDSFDGIDKTDAFNLTVSVDRPTFINFLNQSRTFFFNSQVFFGYVPGYNSSYTSNGPWNILATFTIQTGYYQDRLLPGITWVYDVQSQSGAALPSVTYRFTEAFSATFGLAFFFGRYQGKELPLNPIAPGNQTGAYAYRSWVENGLGVIKDRDEAYVRLRYTF